MGPSQIQSSSTASTSKLLMCAVLVFGICVAPCAMLGQEENAASAGSRATNVAPGTGGPAAGAAANLSINGTVLDVTGRPVVGAEVRLTREPATPVQMTTTQPDGRFWFAGVAPGKFDLSISLAGFKTKSVSGDTTDASLLPAITLDVAPIVTEVSVHLTAEEVAAEQIKVQEQQRLLAVIPNFYTSYVQDAAPMTTKQKFALALRASYDPANIAIAAIIAGGQQANNSFPGYGQGAAGYFNRFGAAYGDFFIGTFVSSAILPSIFKQDPRYFYKGTGTVKSRVLYAISRSVMTKGDNGRWQPDYSGLLGSLASGAISNLYYPEASRHGFSTTLDNTLIGIGTNAGVNLLQEFVFPKITPRLPKKAQPKP